MSNGNARVVLLLVALVVAGGLIAWLLSGGSGDGGTQFDPNPTRSDGTPEGVLLPGTGGKPGALAGRVLVYGSNAPAVGVPVRITGAGDPITVSTGEDGMFAARVPSDRELALTVDAPEPYAPVVVPGIVVDPGDTESLGTLYLNRAFFVKGIVLDGQGRGIPGAAVGAYRPTRFEMGPNLLEWVSNLAKPKVALDQATTGADGTFTLAKLTPGTYRIEALATDFAVGAISEAVVSPDSERRLLRIVLVPGVGLSGTVTSAEGEGIPNAAVTVLRTNRAFQRDLDFQPVQTITDEEGAFAFPQMMPGQVGMIARADGYPMRIVEQLELGQQATVDIVLGGTATLEGTITGPKGEPVAGARVTVAVGNMSAAMGRVVADAEGRYRLDHLPAGSIQFLMVDADEYSSWPSSPNMFMGGRSNLGTLEDGKTLTKDVKLEKGAKVSGIVADAATNAPISGARVRLMNAGGFGGFGGTKSVISDAEGKYEIQGVGEGAHMVLASADGYFQPGMDPMALQRGMGAAMGEGAIDPDLPFLRVSATDVELTKDVKLAAGATIAGTVVGPDGQGVAGAKVTIGSGDDQMGMIARILDMAPPVAMTDDEGNYRVSGAGAGEAVTLTASAEGFVDGTSEPVRVQTGQAVEGVQIRLLAGGSIAGYVYGGDGAPLVGATARAASQPSDEQNEWRLQWELQQAEPTTADEEGRFRIEGLAPGRFVVQLSGPDHLPLTRKEIEVVEGAESEIGSVRLEAGLVIVGVVVDTRGAPIANARIFANLQDPTPGPDFGFNRGNFRSDAKGEFRVSPLTAGDYDVMVTADGYAPKNVRGIAAGRAALRVELEEGLEITGRIVLPDGRPAAQVGIVATDGEGSQQGAQTDEEGRFVIENLPSGSYELIVQAGSRGFGPPAAAAETAEFRTSRMAGVSAGTRDVEIRLEPGLAITGSVVDEAGSPVGEGSVLVARITRPDGTVEQGGFARTDENGEFRLGGLEPGSYTLQVWGQNGTATLEDVAAGSTGVRIAVKAPEPPRDVPRPR